MKQRITILSVALVLLVGTIFVACLRNMEDTSEPESSSSELIEEGAYPIPDRSESLAEAVERNSDVIAWLTIEDTTINEPVVQGADNDYYLRKEWNKNYSYAGCYYFDFRNSFDKLDQNTIIYGHNLGSPMGVADYPDGVKFAQLLKFGREDFAREHPYVYLSTENEDYVFRVFAVFYCEAYTTPVEYHHNAYSTAEFAQLLNDAQARSEFIYDVDVDTSDKILTLSTCSYKYGSYSQNDEQRFVVMARLVRAGELYEETADLKVHPSPKPPNF